MIINFQAAVKHEQIPEFVTLLVEKAMLRTISIAPLVFRMGAKDPEIDAIAMQLFITDFKQLESIKKYLVEQPTESIPQ